MNPSKVILDAITLNGDYEIRGPVVIEKLLSANNIGPEGGKFSLNHVKSYGVRNDTTSLFDMDVSFSQPIRIGSLRTGHINNVNVDNLIKDGLASVSQKITGLKRFTQPQLQIHSRSMVQHVNHINLDQMERELFLPAEDQNITGHIHFKTIHSSR